MASVQTLETEVEVINSRLNRLEHRLQIGKPVSKHKELDPFQALTHFFAKLTPSDTSRYLGGVLIGMSLIGFFLAILQQKTVSPLLGVWTAIGVWLWLRHSSFFGLSDSTLQLLREERSARKTSSTKVHRFGHLHLKKEITPVMQMQLTIIVVGILILSLLYSWLVFYYVTSGVWQTFAFLLITLAGLWYSFLREENDLIYLCTLGIFIILGVCVSPLFSLLALGLFTTGIVYYASKQEDWRLLFAVMLGTYTVLTRWVLFIGDQKTTVATRSIEVIITELAIVFYLIFVLPFIFRRREARERDMVRSTIILNTVAFTILVSWLTLRIVPDLSYLSYGVAVLVAAALTGLAWLEYYRFSYAKYFATAALVAALIGAAFNFQSLLVTLIWFIISVVVLTCGFLYESYSARLAGLVVLGATTVHYLFSSITEAPLSPHSQLLFHERLWLGLLLSGFLCISSLWFRELKTKGAEERYRHLTSFFLLLTGCAVLIGLFLAELISIFL